MLPPKCLPCLRNGGHSNIYFQQFQRTTKLDFLSCWFISLGLFAREKLDLHSPLEYNLGYGFYFSSNPTIENEFWLVKLEGHHCY